MAGGAASEEDNAMKPLSAYDLKSTTKLDDHLQRPDQTVADSSDLIVVIMFSLIGLLIAANLMFRFLDLAVTVEQFNAFAGP